LESTDEQSPGDVIWRLSIAASTGDDSAFRELFDRYYGRTYRYALVAASGDIYIAQETAHEVFVRLHRHLQPFQSDERIWSWLTHVARSVLVDFSRIRTRQLKLQLAFQVHAVADEEPDSDAFLLEKLASCINDLPEDERRLLESFYFGKQSIHQISDALGATYKAVESKLSRSKAKLRKSLLKRIAHE
jgi:RNA polymerase sigma-70 factor, ECF subfamily